MPKRALIVVEEHFSGVRNGPASMNETIASALASLNFDITVIVVGRNIGRPFKRTPVRPDERYRVMFAHARVWLNRMIPWSVAAWARNIGPQILKEKFRKRTRKTAIIGRFISEFEVDYIRKVTSAEKFDFIFIDTIFRSPALKCVSSSTKKYLIAHDVFYQRVQSFSKNGYSVFPSLTFEDEKNIICDFDGVIAINYKDKLCIESMKTSTSVTIVNPVGNNFSLEPDRFFEKNLKQFKKSNNFVRILYIGTAAYHNIDGINWFLDNIWPKIIQNNNLVLLDVVGTVCNYIKKGRTNVILHGWVDNIASVAGNCAFAISPARMGSGTSIKIIDYFKLGLCCIVTADSTGAFSDDQAPVVVAQNEEEFVNLVNLWTGDLNTPIGLSSRIPGYLSKFSRQAATQALSELIGGGA